MSKQMLLTGIITLYLMIHATAASAELVVVANPHVGFDHLKQGELRRIFLGQTSKFPNGEIAEPLDVSGDYRNAFYQSILNKTPEQVETYWAKMIFTGKAEPARQVRPQEVKQEIAESSSAISYMDRSQADASVKIISIIRE
ncbi:MAG: hypothetical protein NVS3B3_11760 [Aquirhabdus sp.]